MGLPALGVLTAAVTCSILYCCPHCKTDSCGSHVFGFCNTLSAYTCPERRVKDSTHGGTTLTMIAVTIVESEH